MTEREGNDEQIRDLTKSDSDIVAAESWQLAQLYEELNEDLKRGF